MSLDWIHEQPPLWDMNKARVVGAAPHGIFDLGDFQVGDPMPGEWWRVDDDGQAVGYGWLDVVWGDAEILLVVEPSRQGQGVGAFILDQLERESAQRGLNYICNVVKPTHPEGERLTAWLVRHGFEAASDGVLRRRVRAAATPSG